MAHADIEHARGGYALLNEAYAAGDVEVFRPHLEQWFDPDVVFVPAGILPESGSAHGIEGVLRFTAEQMKAFADRSMWLQPLEYIDAGDRIVVPYRFGGKARHTGLNVEWEFAHVFTQRHGARASYDDELPPRTKSRNASNTASVCRYVRACICPGPSRRRTRRPRSSDAQ